MRTKVMRVRNELERAKQVRRRQRAREQMKHKKRDQSQVCHPRLDSQSSLDILMSQLLRSVASTKSHIVHTDPGAEVVF